MLQNGLILAHRGFWQNPAEKNSEKAFIRAFESGFGIETDLRDCEGKVVISHDPPKSGNCLTFDSLLKLYHSSRANSLLALNF